MDDSTIAAIATPTGIGGIGIIKISGQDAVSIAISLFQPSCRRELFSKKGISVQSHHLYHGHITDPENGHLLDEVLLTIMRSPRSYTREDVVEIQAHSGHVVLRSILNLVLKKGARLAEPGEFTKRAYINGRIDLTQAEAVIDIINAKTDKALEFAVAQIRGNMRAQIESVKDALLNILAGTEAAIDFPEDIEEDADMEAILDTLQNEVIHPLNDLIGHYKNAHFLRDGLKTLIVGRPNVGKSSLLNALIRKERAIVTPVPGTTRDAIEEILNIRGIPIIITDTAGMHETDDPIEILGIGKTREYIDEADLILFVTDLSEPFADDDHKIYETIRHKIFVIVANKSDLVDEGFYPDIPDFWKLSNPDREDQNIRVIKTSAIYKKGTDALMDFIADRFMGEYQGNNAVIPNLRHKMALEKSLQAVTAAAEGIHKGTPSELISIDIKEAIDVLGEITGTVIKEADVLDQIFNRFCIGK